MQIGTGLFTAQAHQADGQTTTDRYDEILELTGTVESAGLDSAWTSEHHFEPDEYLSATMPVLGAMAAVTESIEIGPCIALAPLYHPVRLAEDAATIDHLADGRLTLGLAIGSNAREFQAFGVPPDERADRLEDAITFLRNAWSDGPLDYESEFFDVDPDVAVTPSPTRGDCPILLGGGARPAVRRAARRADAWCSPSSLSVEGVKKRVDDIETIREDEGRSGDFQIYVIQHGWVGDSRAAAWETMQDGYFHLQRRYKEIFSDEPGAVLDAGEKRDLKDRAIFGAPADVAAELDRYREALGDDIHVIFRTYYPSVDTDAAVACIERLGDDVAPEFQ